MTRSPSLAMQQYSIEPITAKYEKGYGFLSFYHLLEKIKKKNCWPYSLKTASEKVVHKTFEILGNKTADATIKSNDNKILKKESV